MGIKVSDGQLDFLGLLNEYTDDQGATVRVREPGGHRSRLREKTVPDFEQLSFDFEEVKVPEPKIEERQVSEPVTEKIKVPEPVTEEIKTPEPVTEEIKAPEPVIEEIQVSKPVIEEVKAPEPKKVRAAKKAAAEQLFKQCINCWCFDCKHNARNEAVPRDLCGKSMPCPACKSCEAENTATICEIGNAKEGCMTRALEEGIFIPDEM